MSDEVSTSSPAAGWSYLTWVCASSSLLLFFIFITLAAHVWLGLGHWPQPMRENYHSVGFIIHGWALSIGFLLSCGAPVIWLLCFTAKTSRPKWPRPVMIQISMYALGWLLIAGVFKYDPTTFTEWFLD